MKMRHCGLSVLLLGWLALGAAPARGAAIFSTLPQTNDAIASASLRPAADQGPGLNYARPGVHPRFGRTPPPTRCLEQPTDGADPPTAQRLGQPQHSGPHSAGLLLHPDTRGRHQQFHVHANRLVHPAGQPEIRFIRILRAQPSNTSRHYVPVSSYLVSWIARIFSLKNSLSRNPYA